MESLFLMNIKLRTYMNILANKRLLTLPIILVLSLLISSILFFNQIDKLKYQIDNLYFGTFIPVNNLHNVVRIYNKAIYSKKLLKSQKKNIHKKWNNYYNSYKTNKEKKVLDKINNEILISFKQYDTKLLENLVKNINNIITYEVKIASKQRKTFLIQYEQMKNYLTYILLIILVLSLVFVSYIIYLNLQKHTELEKLTNKYKIDSITDSLSNLYNRKYFDEVLDKTSLISFENNWTCAFIMLDIDFFKPFNDNYGHDMGDMAIKSVAKTLRNSFNKKDEYVFRIGGEEFGIIVFDIDIIQLKKSLDNFQNNIEKLKIEHSSSKTGFLTVSMGISIIENNNPNIETSKIYKQADNKLYYSKENGRNQYTI
jgi:diguanylate cyclase (GGDEF)-like protein